MSRSFVAAIERPPRRPWRWATAALGVAGAATLASVLVLRRARPRRAADDLARTTVRPRPAPSSRGRSTIPASSTPPQRSRRSIRFTTDYRKGLRDSCRATRGGAQSATIGDKRTACLELAKRRAWFVTSGLVQGVDPRPGLATLLDELPDVYACSDAEWLDRASPLPVAQADRDALYAAEKDLLEAARVRDDGKLAEASRCSSA